MESLIYLLPVLIFFFVIMAKIIKTFKRLFDFIQEKAAEIERERKEDYSKRKDSNYDYQYDHQEEAYDDYKLAYEEEKVEEDEQVEAEKSSTAEEAISKDKAKKQKERSISAAKKGKVYLAEEFKDFSELEKAVIYKEILSEPKALQKRR
ncbi:hypothetical protein LJ207_08670 [Halanaerobium sp. Z-7514]|uniref:Uncharacterized protein n=1 Tax=Halanaerobium polyolivorans TaxID=2886943 RepID=A0AAW4X0S0_9FIRM|nr:hypothetical protein [Halanaerobium polyolivorans]MCC3145393.1 hypothetical protein [Halanaerobium polyolivorans]